MKQNKKIKTRIAPSPTGFLHIGTARTALFNYLFAKKNNGQYIMRIEDTDPVRSKPEYEKDIINGLKWLGLNWDGQITYQSKRKEIYQKYVNKLIDLGAAYKKDGAVWFKLDSYKKDVIKYRDLILGDLEFKKEIFNDFVLIKKDGVPLYQFACVVDDSQMEITHVIRGADHINSTPQQIMLYEILGLEKPEFAHIPLILNEDKSKMSKRKNPVSISKDFCDKGYLPEALINYMALLGWNPKNEQEFFTLKELEKAFDIKQVNKSGAIFDIKKLNYFNNYYIRNLSDNFLLSKISKLQASSFKLDAHDHNFLLKIIHTIKSRMNVLSEFDELSYYFYKLPVYNKEMLIFKKSTKENTLIGLKSVYENLEKIPEKDWEKIDKLNEILLNIVKEKQLTNGDIFWPVRVALSGLEKSPSPVELLWVLNRKESLTRLRGAINRLGEK